MAYKWMFAVFVVVSVVYVASASGAKAGRGEDCDWEVTCKPDMVCNETTWKCDCTGDNYKWNPIVNKCENFTNFVKEVTQNYWAEINDLIVDQVTKELQASYIYQAYASYFQRADVALPGVQKFFAAASLEEREHAQMLIDYINTRGGHAQFSDITLSNGCAAVAEDKDAKEVRDDDKKRMCICHFVSKRKTVDKCGNRDEWKNALVAFEDALATERYVNRQLLDIHTKADKAKDAHLTHVLEHHFLEEQVTSINQLAHFVTRLRSFKGSNYHLGEYLFDQNLK